MRSLRTIVFITVAGGLSGGLPVLGQSYSPLYPPSSSQQLTAVCYDQYGSPIPDAYFSLYTGARVDTNFHDHDSPLGPYSSVSPVSGYSDIFWNDHPELWILIGGNTTNHGDNSGNHWMQCTNGCTGRPAYGYYYTTSAYVSQYNSGNQECANDMALPFGGKFDIQDNWTSPHASHDRGSAVDTATTTSQCPSANVVTNPNTFLQVCVNNGALPYPTSQVDPADVHCNWDNPSTYPH